MSQRCLSAQQRVQITHLSVLMCFFTAAHICEENFMKLLEISAQIHPSSQHLFNAYIQSGFASRA